MIEAICNRCGETFNPNDEEDLEHMLTNDEEECGGEGTLTGHWE